MSTERRAPAGFPGEAGASADTELSERHYRQLFEHANDAILIADEEGRYVDANRRAEELTGYSRAELRQLSVADLTPAFMRDRGQTLYERFVSAGTMSGEYVIQRKDGTHVDVEFSATLVAPRRFQSILRDITERKAAEAERERLLALERRRTLQLSGLAHATALINSLLPVEQVLERIAGLAREVVGVRLAIASFTREQDWSTAIDATSLSEEYGAWREHRVPPERAELYAMVCDANQPVRLTQASLEAHPRWRPFTRGGGEYPPLRGWLAAPLVARDGTNRGLIQLSDKEDGEFTSDDEVILEQLAQAASIAVENAQLYHQAQRAIRARDEFVSIAAHELKTPLTTVRGTAQVTLRRLQERGRLELDQVRLALRTIDQQAVKLGRQVEQLLDVTRIDTGKLGIRPERHDVAALAREVVATAQGGTERHEIHFDAPSTAWASVDAPKIEQVLWNLLDNAIKYSPNGGTVLVEITIARAQGHDTDGTGNTGDAEVVRIAVRDWGVGIPPERRENIFERYFQAHEAGYLGGIGLGLYVSRQIAELHHGTLAAEFPEDGGTRFVVTLPAT